MVVAYTLFPDGREYETAVALVNACLRARNAVTGADYHPPFHPMSSIADAPRAWRSVGKGIEPDEMLRILAGVDWVYPALVVYRVQGADTRWNMVTLGMAPAWAGEAP